MTKSQLHVKQICPSSLILKVTNNEKNNHYADIMIRNFHISHNAPYLPPKILHNLCFSFLLGITAVPRKIQSNAYAKFWGGNKVYYGKSASDIRDFVARNCLDNNGLQAQAVGYKRILFFPAKISNKVCWISWHSSFNIKGVINSDRIKDGP